MLEKKIHSTTKTIFTLPGPGQLKTNSRPPLHTTNMTLHPCTFRKCVTMTSMKNYLLTALYGEQFDRGLHVVMKRRHRKFYFVPIDRVVPN